MVAPLSGDRRLCLVTGGTGAVGPALIEELHCRGFQVRVLARRPTLPPGLPGVEMARGDVTDWGTVERAVSGVDTVFHLAARLHVPNPSPEMRAEYERVNVGGTRVVVEAARRAGVRRMVLFSTVSVYGPTGTQAVDETHEPAPDSVYGETKLQAEGVALRALDGNGLPLSTVLRMAAVYGPRVKGNYAGMVEALDRGRFPIIGSGTNLRTLVYDRDAARAALLAAEHPLAAGRVYNVTDGAVHSLREITLAICDALGRRPSRIAIPVPAARVAAFWADLAVRLAGGTPSFAAAVEKLTESVSVKGDRIQRELGFVPKFDLIHGWRQTVALMRDWKES